MKKALKKSHKQVFDPEPYIVAQDSLMQIRTRAMGLAFLIVGSVLVFLAVLLAQNNTSVADYIASIFMQFLPGAILVVSAFKLLLPRK